MRAEGQVAEVKQISVEEAARLMEDGAVYVDVRSEPEFESVMQQAFGRAERLIMGCRSGQRSLRAAEILLLAGYQDVVNLLTGWEGTRDAFGRPLPGWRAKGLPVEKGQPEGRHYQATKSRTPK